MLTRGLLGPACGAADTIEPSTPRGEQFGRGWTTLRKLAVRPPWFSVREGSVTCVIRVGEAV